MLLGHVARPCCPAKLPGHVARPCCSACCSAVLRGHVAWPCYSACCVDYPQMYTRFVMKLSMDVFIRYTPPRCVHLQWRVAGRGLVLEWEGDGWEGTFLFDEKETFSQGFFAPCMPYFCVSPCSFQDTFSHIRYRSFNFRLYL